MYNYFAPSLLFNSQITQNTPIKLIAPRSPQSLPLPTTGSTYQGKNIYTVVEDKDLGKGTFGSVKLVREKVSGKLYAMKIMSKEKVKTLKAEDNIRRELALQSKLNFKNILKLHEHFEDKGDILMVLEYCSKGNLYQLLKKKKKLTELEAFPLFHQLCQSVEYLHFQGIVHRDIKPENILFYEDKSIKLCDYNWAKKLNPGQKCDPVICGTTEYMPPEVVAKQSHDLKVDIWSLGIILYEFFHGDLPYKGHTQKEKIASILGNQLKVNSNLPQDLQNLITQLLQRLADQRPSFQQINKSKWFLRMMKELQFQSTPPRPQTVYTKGRGQQSERLSFFSNASSSQNTNSANSTAISKSKYLSTDKLAVVNFQFKKLAEWESKLKSSGKQPVKMVPVKAFGLNSTAGFGQSYNVTKQFSSEDSDKKPQIKRATSYVRPHHGLSSLPVKSFSYKKEL